MRLLDLYQCAVEEGKKKDPRGLEAVEEVLNQEKECYKKLTNDEQEKFDTERLTNPYADTRILHGNPNTDIQTVLVGIDIDSAELLLAERLRAKGEKVDLVISHHPSGRAYANFYEVMDMQAEILHIFGVPINVAEHLLEKRVKEVEKRVMPNNHMRAMDTAHLLDIPFMCTHTVADNQVASCLQEMFDKKRPKKVDEVVKILEGIPEYRDASRYNNPPKILLGGGNSSCGKIFVDMTGGTEGSPDIFERLTQAGIGTLVAMHLSEKHLENAEKAHLNVVVAGHISSDNLGMNLLFDSLIQKFGSLKIIECSGFRRFQHSS